MTMTMTMTMINIAKSNRIKAPKVIPTAMPILVAPFELFLFLMNIEVLFVLMECFEIILDECRKGDEWTGFDEFEIFAIWIVEENPPKTKIWANNSPAINPVKFEQVKEKEVTEVTWQLGFDDEDEDE